MKKNETLSEYEEAVVLAQYLTLKGYKFSHIPAETFTKSWGVKMRNKRQGVNRGVPDYLIVKGNKLIFCELKRTKGGVISEQQQSWINALNECMGVVAFVAKGFEEAKKMIESV